VEHLAEAVPAHRFQRVVGRLVRATYRLVGLGALGVGAQEVQLGLNTPLARGVGLPA